MSDKIIWVPLRVVAQEYEKTPQMIRNWVRSGFILELGFHVKRDVTGHFKIGVPYSRYANFANNQIDSVVNQGHNI